jgi:tetratricopeptide (TPR) repeat protein
VSQFEKALALTPDSASLHTAFGMALLEHGRPDDAIPHFEKALSLAPADPRPRYDLGSTLRSQRKAAEALTQWRQALEAQPDLVQALDRAAWVMATSREASVRNGAKAVELAERAVEVSGGQQPRILATLAASYAEAGGFPKAVETAHRVLDLAARQNQQALAGGLHAMLTRYEAGAPFRDVR